MELPHLSADNIRFLVLPAFRTLKHELHNPHEACLAGDTATAVAAAVRQLAGACGSVRLHYQLMQDPAEQRREDAVRDAAAQAARAAGACMGGCQALGFAVTLKA